MMRIKTWVPNLFTLGNLSLGFFAILLSFHAQHTGADVQKLLSLAGALILLAVLCDGLDGFAARLLNSSSEVGAQLDSLADMTTFGIAPGALMYSYTLHKYSLQITEQTTIPIGMFIAAIFPICAAYRLARFNVQHAADYFHGLPSPIAGTIVALIPLIAAESLLIPAWLLSSLFILVAFLMVSTVKYSKPQVSRRFTPMRLAILVGFMSAALIFIGFRYYYEYSFMGLFFIIVIYVMSGIISFIIQLIQKYRV